MRARRSVHAAIVLVLTGVLTIGGWGFCQLGRKAPAFAPASARERDHGGQRPQTVH